jgi:predicted nucleic acid-binding protein
MKLGSKYYKKIGVDTVIFIYVIQYEKKYRKFSDQFLSAINNDNLKVITSMMSLIETLVGPYKHSDHILLQFFQEAFADNSKIETKEVNEKVATEAAKLCANYNLSEQDGIQVATAITNNCEAFLTNDKTLKKVKDIEVLVLDDLF